MKTWLVIAGLTLGLAPSPGASPPIVVSGYVEATEVRVSAKGAGTVEELGFDEGDPVEAGRVLARLDPTDVKLQLRAARAERNQAEAELRLRLAGARVEDIAEAQAQENHAAADLANAEIDWKRTRELREKGVTPSKALDDARARRDMAAHSFSAARERTRRLKAGSRPQEIDAARARLATADARIAQYEQQLVDLTVKSPLSGVVTEKLVERGELLSRGTAVAVVTDLARPWLAVYVAEPELESVRLGSKVEVVTDGGQRRIGRVGFVASAAQFTPKNVQTRDERVKLVFKVKINLDNPDGVFKPGLPAEARIPVLKGAR